jgi:hypothetical protein
MNPTQQNPNTTPTDDDSQNTASPTYVPEATPEEDAAALQAIEALEAEDTSVNIAEPTPMPSSPIETPTTPQQAQPTAFTAQPIGNNAPEQPTESISSSPIAPEIPASAAIAGVLSSAPAETNNHPFPNQKKSSKKLILLVVALILLIGAGVAGYFAWQSMQTDNSNNTSQSVTGGDQPGGTTQTDTEADVTEDAAALEADADSMDNSSLEDSSLSDTTLYENQP